MKLIKDNKKRIMLLILIMVCKTLLYFVIKLFQGELLYLNNAIDNIIPFIPEFVYFYIMWYIFLILIPLIILKYNKKVFDTYLITILVYTVIESFVFLIMPTTMVRAQFSVHNLSTWLLNIVYTIDNPVCNLFPSGHCAYCFLFVVSILDIKTLAKKYKMLIIVSSILIILSTVFIKQHVLLDILGSLIIVPIYLILRKRNIKGSDIYAKIFCQKQNR